MMVPKPEPNLPTPIEDEVRPPQVTVESSSSESEDEDRSDYPEGYIPITQYFDVQWAESEDEEEEEDTVTIEEASADSRLHEAEETPAPEEEEGIDYSSLSGLMAALNAHGPTTIEGEEPPAPKHQDDGQWDASMGSKLKKLPKVRMSPHQAPSLSTAPLSEEQSRKVKAAMSGITLPGPAPAWATDPDMFASVKDKLAGK